MRRSPVYWMSRGVNSIYELSGKSHYLSADYRFHVSRHESETSLWFEIRVGGNELGKHLNLGEVKRLVVALQDWVREQEAGVLVPDMCRYCLGKKVCDNPPADGEACHEYFAGEDPEKPDVCERQVAQVATVPNGGSGELH